MTRRPVAFGRPASLALASTLAMLLPAALPQVQAQTLAQATSPAGIYTCTDASGRRLTSDRPIPDCIAREQRVLNADGSVRRVVPPTLTAEERAAREAQERTVSQTAAQQRDVARRDRNLMARYPNEAAHQAAREQALQQTSKAVEASQARLQALASERKPLQDEAEFYLGRSLPPLLKQKLDANDAAARAQGDAVQTQRAELRRVNEGFDRELVRLRRLWAGAAPGSLGPIEEALPAAGAATASAAAGAASRPAAAPPPPR